jgi:hypothetical protein
LSFPQIGLNVILVPNQEPSPGTRSSPAGGPTAYVHQFADDNAIYLDLANDAAEVISLALRPSASGASELGAAIPLH